MVLYPSGLRGLSAKQVFIGSNPISTSKLGYSSFFYYIYIMKKIIFLDHDGVICLSHNWGTRHTKQRKWGKRKMSMDLQSIPIEYRFDNFDKKSIELLNDILEQTNADIVVSSDWRLFTSLNEMSTYYTSQGIIKTPVGFTRKLGDFDVPKEFEWNRQWELEQTRCFEIHQYLKDHPDITHWVAIDDLDMRKIGKHYSVDFEHEWGLDNFVHTPLSREGIKQTGVKEKILSFLT
jgi:hypothetical protein